jgi:hypothetical protein
MDEDGDLFLYIDGRYLPVVTNEGEPYIPLHRNQDGVVVTMADQEVYWELD